MVATIKPLPNQKPEHSWQPGPLTQQEIESLRQSRKADHKHFQELMAREKQRQAKTSQVK